MTLTLTRNMDTRTAEVAQIKDGGMENRKLAGLEHANKNLTKALDLAYGIAQRGNDPAADQRAADYAQAVAVDPLGGGLYLATLPDGRQTILYPTSVIIALGKVQSRDLAAKVDQITDLERNIEHIDEVNSRLNERLRLRAEDQEQLAQENKRLFTDNVQLALDLAKAQKALKRAKRK